jgi:ribosomal protein S14
MIELVVMDATRSRRVENQLYERVRAKTCSCGCGKPTTGFVKLGLCRHCYYEYTETIKSFTKRKAEQYRAKLIREGLLLLPHEIRKIFSESALLAAAKDIKESA